MCDPLSMTAFALTAASSVMQHRQQEAMADAQNARYEQNRLNSLAAMRQDQQAIQQRQQQEMDAAADRVEQRRIQQRQETSSAIVAAGEAGVSGFSVENILRDIGNFAGQDVQNINQNRDWTLNQLNSQLAGTRTTAQSRINSVARATGPSGWGTALQIGSAAVGGYAGYSQRTGNDPLNITGGT